MIRIQKSLRTGLIDFLKKEGNDHINSGRYSNAIELYTKALYVVNLVDECEVIEELIPAILCINMGVCLYKLQKYEKA